MKVRKAIKAIAALGAGISMVGATIMGAMAADLSEYPSPFVTSGAFDGLIVVGDSAAAEDVVGAIDVGTNLQYAMRQEASLGTGLAAVTVSEGKKIEKTGNKLNYGDDLKDIIEVLDDDDLPVILADGRYQDSEGETSNDEKYTQSLRLYDATGTLMFYTDDDGDKVAADYLYFDDGASKYAYNYTLEFDNAIDYTFTATDTPAEDLEDTSLKIQGNDYTITDIKYNTAYNVTKITLLAGETIIWLQQGKTLTRTIGGTEHEIEVTDVNDNEDMCGISVDGDVVWIKKGQTQTINGISVGVTDAVAVHAQLQDVDICKINVGATELILDDGKEVEVNGQDISGSNVHMYTNTGTSGQLQSISVTWVPDDDEYIPAGSNLADPVFNNFEFKFAGMSKKTEEILLTSTTTDAELKVLNNDGKELEIPYYFNTTQVVMGSDFDLTNCDSRLLLEGDNCDSSGTDTGAIEGVMFLLVTTGKEAHVMKISNIGNDNKSDIKDLTYLKTYEDKTVNASGGVSNVTLGSLGTIALNLSGPDGYVEIIDSNLVASEVATNQQTSFETKYGANITLMSTYNEATGEGNGTIRISEENDESNDLEWNLSMYYYNTDTEIRIRAPEIRPGQNTAQWNKTDMSSSKSDRDNKYYASEWGTLALYDSEDDNDLTLWYPDEQAYGNVFIAPIGAVVSGSGGEVSTVTLNPINVGSAKLASEIVGQEKTQNLMVIGGPCANEAAKVIMGTGDDCTEGFTDGKAIIKLYENGGNVAMVIAGYSAADTRRATTVVAKYGDYADKLTGMEVEVSGTSLLDIVVGTPS